MVIWFLACPTKPQLSSSTQLGHELAVTPSHKFDLAYVREMLAALGNPERRFPSVLIAGTNGKGSTAATLSSILRAAGYKTALYSSPHLVRINERMRVNGEAIADVEFSEIYDRVERTAQQLLHSGKLPWHPSFFEMLTVMAFEYFASVGVEIAVLEVGMGGRLDATNVVDPLISVIADISLDHQKYLGDTIGEIAREKAGIIRENGVVVTLPQHPEANDVIGHAILDHHATGISAVKYVPPVSPGAAEFLAGRIVPAPGRNRYPLSVMGEEILVDSPLAGRHQLRNIALAIAAAEELGKFGFKVTPQQIEQGIRETHWPGRFQVLPPSPATHQRTMVLDVAHNPAGAWALRSTLSETFPIASSPSSSEPCATRQCRRWPTSCFPSRNMSSSLTSKIRAPRPPSNCCKQVREPAHRWSPKSRSQRRSAAPPNSLLPTA